MGGGNGDQDTSSGGGGEKCVCGRRRAAEGLKTPSRLNDASPSFSPSLTLHLRTGPIIAFHRSFFRSHHAPLSVSSRRSSLPRGWRDGGREGR